MGGLRENCSKRYCSPQETCYEIYYARQATKAKKKKAKSLLVSNSKSPSGSPFNRARLAACTHPGDYSLPTKCGSVCLALEISLLRCSGSQSVAQEQRDGVEAASVRSDFYRQGAMVKKHRDSEVNASASTTCCRLCRETNLSESWDLFENNLAQKIMYLANVQVC